MRAGSPGLGRMRGGSCGAGGIDASALGSVIAAASAGRVSIRRSMPAIWAPSHSTNAGAAAAANVTPSGRSATSNSPPGRAAAHAARSTTRMSGVVSARDRTISLYLSMRAGSFSGSDSAGNGTPGRARRTCGAVSHTTVAPCADNSSTRVAISVRRKSSNVWSPGRRTGSSDQNCRSVTSQAPAATTTTSGRNWAAAVDHWVGTDEQAAGLATSGAWPLTIRVPPTATPHPAWATTCTSSRAAVATEASGTIEAATSSPTSRTRCGGGGGGATGRDDAAELRPSRLTSRAGMSAVTASRPTTRSPMATGATAHGRHPVRNRRLRIGCSSRW